MSVCLEMFSKISNILPRIHLCWVCLFVCFTHKKVDRSEGNIRSCAWQVVLFWWISARHNKRGMQGIQMIWIPFCLFLSTLSPLLWTPVSHFSISHWHWIFLRRSCSFKCLGGKFCSLSAYCISHPENSQCIWKVSVKGFNCPAKPLSAAFRDYPLCRGGSSEWPGNMRPELASAAGSPSWHRGRLSQCCWLSAAHSHLIPLWQAHSVVHLKKTPGFCWKTLVNQNWALSWESILFVKITQKQRKVCTVSVPNTSKLWRLASSSRSGAPSVHLLGLMASQQPRGLRFWAQFH